MNLIQKGEAQLLDAASTGGQIRIGASDTICRYFLVPYLEKFHKTFPNVHIKVINQTSLKMYRAFKERTGGFDCCQLSERSAQQYFRLYEDQEFP